MCDPVIIVAGHEFSNTDRCLRLLFRAAWLWCVSSIYRDGQSLTAPEHINTQHGCTLKWNELVTLHIAVHSLHIMCNSLRNFLIWTHALRAGRYDLMCIFRCDLYKNCLFWCLTGFSMCSGSVLTHNELWKIWTHALRQGSNMRSVQKKCTVMCNGCE